MDAFFSGRTPFSHLGMLQKMRAITNRDHAIPIAHLVRFYVLQCWCRSLFFLLIYVYRQRFFVALLILFPVFLADLPSQGIIPSWKTPVFALDLVLSRLGSALRYRASPVLVGFFAYSCSLSRFPRRNKPQSKFFFYKPDSNPKHP